MEPRLEARRRGGPRDRAGRPAAAHGHAARAPGPAFGSVRPGKHVITDVLARHEPRVGGFADGGNEWNRSDWYSGTRGDTHCGGRAWAADLHYAAGRAVRIFDRYRRAMFLVNLAERRDGARYAWVAKLRPDLVFAAPVSPGDVFGASNVAVRGDWFNVFERDAATAGLVDGALRYWRCAGVTGLPGKTTVNPETWLADSLRRGGAAFGEPGGGLAAKVCLARSTPDETPACAASRRNATRCGG